MSVPRPHGCDHTMRRVALHQRLIEARAIDQHPTDELQAQMRNEKPAPSVRMRAAPIERWSPARWAAIHRGANGLGQRASPRSPSNGCLGGGEGTTRAYPPPPPSPSSPRFAIPSTLLRTASITGTWKLMDADTAPPRHSTYLRDLGWPNSIGKARYAGASRSPNRARERHRTSTETPTKPHQDILGFNDSGASGETPLPQVPRRAKPHAACQR